MKKYRTETTVWKLSEKPLPPDNSGEWRLVAVVGDGAGYVHGYWQVEKRSRAITPT